MRTHTPTFSLTRRLVDNYLMFGLACMFACLMVVAVPVAQGQDAGQLATVAVIVALALLLFGAFVLRKTSHVNNVIEQQLRTVTGRPEPELEPLRPIRHTDPVAQGWNAILRRLEDQRVMESLEDRLQTTLGSSDSQRWEAAFNSLNDGVAITDAAGVVEAANNSFLALLGKNRDQIAAEPIDALLAEAVGADPKSLPPGLSVSGGKFSCELRKGAEIVAGVWRVHRMPMVDGTTSGGGVVWTVRDVTQQKLAEDMRNQFVFTATHELRTPLSNIRAYAETLSMDDEIDLESQKGFINIINAEATRLARFIDELLDVSQMEAGAISVARHETDVQRLLMEVVEHVQPQVNKKQLQFESVLPPKLPKLKLDKDKFTAAMVNLLGNAVKYTMEGGQVRLLVEVDASQIHFHVEDTGIGIAPEELRRMGEKFFRSQDERIRDIPGSGLGVAFAQEVARLHGGQLNVLSELDKGSRFSLSLPLSNSERL